MDRSRLILTAIDELKQIRSEIPLCRSLDMVRRSFDRLQEIRRQYVDDFDLQLMVAETQQELIERARILRKDPEGVTKTVPASEALSASVARPVPSERSFKTTEKELTDLEEPPPAEIPPEVPKLDQKSWKLAIGLSILFTVGIFAAFFYLIQAARRLNFSSEQPVVTTGPQPPQSVKPAAANAPVTDLALSPSVSMNPTLRLYTDLTGGSAIIDDQAGKELVDGELNLDSLTPGEHTVRVESKGGSAAFTFALDNASDVPHVTKILKSNNALVVLVSVKNGTGRLTTDAEGANVALDDKPAGTVGSDGLLLSDLGNTDHNLEVSQARDKQKFVLTYTPAPTLTVFVKSNPSIGVLTVSTGQDGVSVFINDYPYRRLTDHGAVRIPLKVGSYRIRVHKNGFADPEIAKVEVKKSAEVAVQFHMVPVPSEFATLQINGAQPGTVAYLDHQIVAAVGVDGSAKVVNVKPGVHMIELRHDQALTKQLARTFEAGETLTLSGGDVLLDHLGADSKTVIPGNPGSTVIPPPEVPPLQPGALGAVAGEQVHKGGGFIPYHTPKLPGRYYFQAHTKLGGLLKRGKLQWYAGYQDRNNYVLFSLDGRHAEVREVRDGTLFEVGKTSFNVASDEWVQIEMSVKADALEARAKSGSGDWIDLAPVANAGRDFTKDTVGLYVPTNDEVAIANFRFSGR